MGDLLFVTGGSRSGKSAFAERLAADAPAVIYVATLEPRDTEMLARIERHARRVFEKGHYDLRELLGMVRALVGAGG